MYPFPHLLSGWGKPRKCLIKESRVRFLDGGRGCKEEQREGERELVQMNNLYRIPGIVCQGDDGWPVSKPKQTDYENTHTLSREVDEVIGGCERCFILIARLERLVEQCYTISLGVCVFVLNQLMMFLCVCVYVWLNRKKKNFLCTSVHIDCIIQAEIYEKYCQHDVWTLNEIRCNLLENSSFPCAPLQKRMSLQFGVYELKIEWHAHAK